MIGVVLWSDANDRKAVFWCEDQGDLAYFECASKDSSGYHFFDAGDMVQFEVTMERRMRKAHNPTLILQNACAGLPETLRQRAEMPQPTETVNNSAQIIPFSEQRSTPPMRRAALKA